MYSLMNFPKSDEKSVGNKVVQRNIVKIYVIIQLYYRVKLTKVFLLKENTLTFKYRQCDGQSSSPQPMKEIRD